MVTYKTLMQQDRGWGLVCQMSVAPLVAGTLEWLIAVCAFWFIGAHYLAPWTWLAHLAAAYPLGGPAMWLRVGALAWAGWAFMRSGIDWATLAVFLWILLIPALTQLPHRWGGWARAHRSVWPGLLVPPADGSHRRPDRPGGPAPGPALNPIHIGNPRNTQYGPPPTPTQPPACVPHKIACRWPIHVPTGRSGRSECQRKWGCGRDAGRASPSESRRIARGLRRSGAYHR